MIDPRAQASAHNISASSPTLPSCGAQFDPTIISEILGGAQRCFEVHFTPELDSTMNLRTFCEKADIPIRAGLVLI
ncbi:MAG: hypothetical protein RL417_109, partial [Pseudomonadota bacterium]